MSWFTPSHIKETCACGSGFEAAGPSALQAYIFWQGNHQWCETISGTQPTIGGRVRKASDNGTSR